MTSVAVPCTTLIDSDKVSDLVCISVQHYKTLLGLLAMQIEMFVCQKCQRAIYCSENCKRVHTEQHKRDCKMWQLKMKHSRK